MEGGEVSIEKGGTVAVGGVCSKERVGSIRVGVVVWGVSQNYYAKGRMGVECSRRRAIELVL